MKKKGGYGVIHQDVIRNSNISAAAKGLYAFCGASDECYPSVETIIKEMGMGRDIFYRHINALVVAGVKMERIVEKKLGYTYGGGITPICLYRTCGISQNHHIFGMRNMKSSWGSSDNFKKIMNVPFGQDWLIFRIRVTLHRRRYSI